MGATVLDADGLFGHVNDSIRGLAPEGPADESWEFICECPDLECHSLVTLTLREFDTFRSALPPTPILSLIHAN